MRIPEEKVREVQTKADIVSVISKYTKLQKKGQDYVGLCLFHQDNHPSMSVSPSKRFFKCFSCGVGGNVIDFVMKYKHLSFVETVVELATEFNVDLGDFQSSPQTEKYSDEEKKLFAINEAALKYYQVNLNSLSGVEAKKYLTGRQLSDEQIKQWEIGFAIGHEIIDHLVQLGYQQSDVVNAGLATQKDNGVFDYFVERIVFPIKNQDGYVIGFSGRTLTDEKPKYLNTRETLIFKKSSVLFNLDQVWQVKERLDSIILLEGFMDVISLKKVGVDNALALMGTALSNFHLQKIIELRKPVKLFLDGDQPGMEAMYKIAQVFIEKKIPFSIIDNITNQDPDELINSGKTTEVLKMINQSVNPYEYFLTKMSNDKKSLTIDETNFIIDKILQLLKGETNFVVIDQVLSQLSAKFKIDKAALTSQLETIKPIVRQKSVKVQISKKSSKPIWDKYDIGRNRIFISLLKSPDYLAETEPVLYQISENNFTYEKIFKTLIDFYHHQKYLGNDLTIFFNLIDESNFSPDEVDLLHQLVEDPTYGFTNNLNLNQKEFNDILKQFKLRDLESQRKNIGINLKKLEQEQLMETDKHQREVIDQKIKNIQIRFQKINDKIRELRQEEN